MSCHQASQSAEGSVAIADMSMQKKSHSDARNSSVFEIAVSVPPSGIKRIHDRHFAP